MVTQWKKNNKKCKWVENGMNLMNIMFSVMYSIIFVLLKIYFSDESTLEPGTHNISFMGWTSYIYTSCFALCCINKKAPAQGGQSSMAVKNPYKGHSRYSQENVFKGTERDRYYTIYYCRSHCFIKGKTDWPALTTALRVFLHQFESVIDDHNVTVSHFNV